MDLYQIRCLKEYKTNSEFNSVDFDAIKTLFGKSDNCPFGSIVVSEKPTGELTKNEKKLCNKTLKTEQYIILQGYNHSIEKSEDYASRLLESGNFGWQKWTRGKIVYDNYDDLRDISGDSENTTPLSTGADSSLINDRSCGIFSYQDPGFIK